MSKPNKQRPCMNPNKDQKTMSTNILRAQPASKKGPEIKTQQHQISSYHSQRDLRQTMLQRESSQSFIKVQKKEDQQLHQPLPENREQINSIELIVNKMKQGIQTINKKAIQKVGGDVVSKLKDFVGKEKAEFQNKNEERVNKVMERVKAIQDMQEKKLKEIQNDMKGRQGKKIEEEQKLLRKIKQLQKDKIQIGIKLQESKDKNKQNENNNKIILELKTKLQQLNTQNSYLEHDNKKLTQIKQDHEILINNLSNSLANRQKQLTDVKNKLLLEQKIRNQLEKQIKIIKDDVKKAKNQIIGMFGYRVQGSNNGGSGSGNGNGMGSGGQRRNNDIQEIERIGISQIYANCLQPFTKFRDRFMPIAKKLLKIQINNNTCSNIQQIQQFNQLKTLLTFLPPQPSQTTSLKTISTLLSTLLQHLSTQITYTSNIKKYIVNLQQSMKIINNTISEIIKNGSYHSINVIKDYDGNESCVYREMRDIAEKVKDIREEVGRGREEVGREKGERVKLEGVVKELRQYIGQLQDFKSKADKNTKNYQQKLSEQRKQTQQLKLHIQTLQKSLQNSTVLNSTLTQQLQQKKQQIKQIEQKNKIQWKKDMSQLIKQYAEQKTRITINYQNLQKINNKLINEIGEEKKKYGEIQRRCEERLMEKDEIIGGLKTEADNLRIVGQVVNRFAENSE